MSEIYGVTERADVIDDIGRAVEEIRVRGYTIFPCLFSSRDMPIWRNRIDEIYARQEREYGRDALIAIKDSDICRAPLFYNFSFVEFASHPTILKVARKVLGDWIVLHLQNAIISRPQIKHHQASWHRDLPHQNWIISKPLSLSFIVAIDDFSPETGGTRLLPFSHQAEIMPSEAYTQANAVDATVPAGSVIVFDSMLFHQAGDNRSEQARRAVNHMYTVPILKQQYDFAGAFASCATLTTEMKQLLGCTSLVPADDRAWRKARAQRLSGSY